MLYDGDYIGKIKKNHKNNNGLFVFFQCKYKKQKQKQEKTNTSFWKRIVKKKSFLAKQMKNWSDDEKSKKKKSSGDSEKK